MSVNKSGSDGVNWKGFKAGSEASKEIKSKKLYLSKTIKYYQKASSSLDKKISKKAGQYLENTQFGKKSKGEKLSGRAKPSTGKNKKAGKVAKEYLSLQDNLELEEVENQPTTFHKELAQNKNEILKHYNSNKTDLKQKFEVSYLKLNEETRNALSKVKQEEKAKNKELKGLRDTKALEIINKKGFLKGLTNPVKLAGTAIKYKFLISRNKKKAKAEMNKIVKDYNKKGSALSAEYSKKLNKLDKALISDLKKSAKTTAKEQKVKIKEMGRETKTKLKKLKHDLSSLQKKNKNIEKRFDKIEKTINKKLEKAGENTLIKYMKEIDKLIADSQNVQDELQHLKTSRPYENLARKISGLTAKDLSEKEAKDAKELKVSINVNLDDLNSRKAKVLDKLMQNQEKAYAKFNAETKGIPGTMSRKLEKFEGLLKQPVTSIPYVNIEEIENKNEKRIASNNLDTAQKKLREEKKNLKKEAEELTNSISESLKDFKAEVTTLKQSVHKHLKKNLPEYAKGHEMADQIIEQNEEFKEKYNKIKSLVIRADNTISEFQKKENIFGSKKEFSEIQENFKKEIYNAYPDLFFDFEQEIQTIKNMKSDTLEEAKKKKEALNSIINEINTSKSLIPSEVNFKFVKELLPILSSTETKMNELLGPVKITQKDLQIDNENDSTEIKARKNVFSEILTSEDAFIESQNLIFETTFKRSKNGKEKNVLDHMSKHMDPDFSKLATDYKKIFEGHDNLFGSILNKGISAEINEVPESNEEKISNFLNNPISKYIESSIDGVKSFKSIYLPNADAHKKEMNKLNQLLDTELREGKLKDKPQNILNIESYLIKLVQRGPKFPLFLRDALKTMSKDDPLYELISNKGDFADMSIKLQNSLMS